MAVPLGRIIIYTKKLEELAEFYCKHFGFTALHHEGDRLVELNPPTVGVSILLHPASKGQKEGQSLMKLVFDVEDVEAFCLDAEKQGLLFGAIHHCTGYAFANAKDPSNNSVSVSSRAFVK